MMGVMPDSAIFSTNGFKVRLSTWLNGKLPIAG
jgi:hypothetical protein